MEFGNQQKFSITIIYGNETLKYICNGRFVGSDKDKNIDY